MRLRRLLLASACALAFAHTQAAAQSKPAPTTPRASSGGGGMPNGLPTMHETVSDADNYTSTRSVSGAVVEVNLDEGYIVVAVPKRGEGKFFILGKTRLKADKETPLGEKKKLTLEDFKKGQRVKVTFWPQNFEATEVRAHQPKS